LSNTHINKDILGVIYNLHDKENDYKKKDITQPVHFVRELGWEIVHKAKVEMSSKMNIDGIKMSEFTQNPNLVLTNQLTRYNPYQSRKHIKT